MSDHEHDALINEIASELKRPVRFSEDFDARVMSAIRTSHLSVIRGDRAHAAGGRGARRVLVPSLGGLAAAAVLTFAVMRVGTEPSMQQIADTTTPLVQVADAGEERMILQDVQLSLYLPHAKSVGVMGDNRTYETTLAIRAVHSSDGMTDDWVRLPYDVMNVISTRIVNEVKGINRVVYDITSKPPATIE